jgi:small subunit ribosomal protein S21
MFGTMFDRREPRSAPLGGVKVVPEPFETIDSIARRFKKAVMKSLVLSDARRHEHFVSKSERRRVKSRKARRRLGV